MTKEIKLNKGAIFPNEYKKTDSQPDWKGKINVDGKIKEIALWANDHEGKKYFGVQISDEYVKPETKKSDAPEPEEDSLPF